MFYVCFNTNIVLCKSFYHKVVIIIQGKCAEIADRLDTLRINPTKNTANDYIEIGAVKLNDKLEQQNIILLNTLMIKGLISLE